MSEMVERVARALLEAGCDEPGLDDYRDMARAAIKAMISSDELAANDDQCLANLVRARFNVGI